MATYVELLRDDVFNAIKEHGLKGLEGNFKRAYGIAASQHRLSRGQFTNFFPQVKRAVRTLLIEHDREIALPEPPNYFKFRRPIPEIDWKRLAANDID